MRRRWKITWGVLVPLLALWLAEPYITEWYYKKECSFGSVSKEEYAKIRDRAKEITRNWDWSRKASLSSQSISEPYMTEFLVANLVKFIPENAPTDVKIAHALAFMEGVGTRIYSKSSSKGYYISKGQKPVVGIRYAIYRMKMRQYSPILLAPRFRFQTINIKLQEGASGNGIVKYFIAKDKSFSFDNEFWLEALISIDFSLLSLKPLGCVEEELFKYWGLSW